MLTCSCHGFNLLSSAISEPVEFCRIVQHGTVSAYVSVPPRWLTHAKSSFLYRIQVNACFDSRDSMNPRASFAFFRPSMKTLPQLRKSPVSSSWTDIRVKLSCFTTSLCSSMSIASFLLVCPTYRFVRLLQGIE